MMHSLVPRAFSEQRLREQHINRHDISLNAAQQLDLHLRLDALAPNETGGYITWDGEIQECPNIFDGDKRHGFDMEVDLRPDIIAIWHTHPNGQVNASQDDADQMIQLWRQLQIRWPWVVVSPFTITTWRFDGAAFTVVR